MSNSCVQHVRPYKQAKNLLVFTQYTQECTQSFSPCLLILAPLCWLSHGTANVLWIVHITSWHAKHNVLLSC